MEVNEERGRFGDDCVMCNNYKFSASLAKQKLVMKRVAGRRGRTRKRNETVTHFPARLSRRNCLLGEESI